MRPIKSRTGHRKESGEKKKFLLKQAKKGVKVRAGEEATIQCLSSLTFALCDLAGCTDMGPVAGEFSVSPGYPKKYCANASCLMF